MATAPTQAVTESPVNRGHEPLSPNYLTTARRTRPQGPLGSAKIDVFLAHA